MWIQRILTSLATAALIVAASPVYPRGYDFELRQLTALRKELDEEYQASIMSPARSSQPLFSSKLTP
jgi:hypothetical protein